MASTVVNNPESIHQFRGQIVEAIEKLDNQLKKTERAIEVVSESWKDDQFQQFRANFDVDKEQIRPLQKVLNNYENNILYNLEQKLLNYQGVSMRI